MTLSEATITPLSRTEKYGNFEIVLPKESLGTTVLWQFGQDPFSAKIAAKLGYAPTQEEIDFITAACSRDEQALSSLFDISGRTALFPACGQELTIGTQPYSTLEIGGFGRQVISRKVGEAIGLFNRAEPVYPPSNDDFHVLHPGIAETEVMTDKGIKVIGRDFSFNGAYTRRKVAYKTAANLFVLQKTLEKDQVPLLVPVPIAIGVYPGIKGPDAEPAYFLATRVPYEGMRLGSFDLTKIKDAAFISGMMVSSLGIINPLRYFFHDELCLTHNQVVPGNYFIPDGKNKLPFLADFSTVWPLSLRYFANARARELVKLLHTLWQVVQTRCPNPSHQTEAEFTQFMYRQALGRYLGYSQYPFPKKMDEVEEALTREIETASSSIHNLAPERVKIPRPVNSARSERMIELINRDFLRAVAI